MPPFAIPSRSTYTKLLWAQWLNKFYARFSLLYAYVNFLTDFYAILHQPTSEREGKCALEEIAMMEIFYFQPLPLSGLRSTKEVSHNFLESTLILNFYGVRFKETILLDLIKGHARGSDYESLKMIFSRQRRGNSQNYLFVRDFINKK